jgi:2-desacetyl-2-hydroxyethyl bacteriochlorophyllide A dehydrogenase
MMIRRALVFLAPENVEICTEEISEPGPGQVLVESLLSAISAGSELLVYRGRVPEHMTVDPVIPSLSATTFAFPLKYGYSAVGSVTKLGSGVEMSWLDRLVFSFQPHQSHFIAHTSELLPLPPGVTAEEAVFLAQVETAITLVMDGRPMIGEAVVVFGQGIVGLLVTALLSRFPLAHLITLDPYGRRREMSESLGAQQSLDPTDARTVSRIQDLLQATSGADLVYEVSGNTEAINFAIETCGFGSRIVLGSWYGRQPATLELGCKFHRERIHLVSSQVSTLAPALSGRWNKNRRLDAAWQWLRRIGPHRLITRRFPLERAAEAYRLLHEEPSRDLQIVFTYKNEL